MRNRLALAVVVAALPVSVVAAQSRFTSPPAQTRQAQSQMRWANMDSNGDGVITRGEWRGTAEAFRNADWNGDGILSGDEVRLDATRNTRRTVDTAVQQRDARFRTLDGDNDGYVTRWEWPETWQAFNALDQNGDDVLTRAEVVGPTTSATDDTVVSSAGRATRRGVATSGDIVVVNPRERWTDTGLDVVAGDRLYFDAEGQLQLSEGGPDVATPGGAASGRRAPSAPLPRATAGALIARIGTSPPLLIGNQRVIARAPVSGRLYLGVNDDHLADNSGEYRVSVTLEGR
jgi:hypothetical protein